MLIFVFEHCVLFLPKNLSSMVGIPKRGREKNVESHTAMTMIIKCPLALLDTSLPTS